MDSIDKDLRSILQIRKMRADSLSRAARAREMERNSMAKDVVDKVQALRMYFSAQVVSFRRVSFTGMRKKLCPSLTSWSVLSVNSP